MERADHDHFAVIGEKLAGGRMIPFVGAGANLCDRGEEAWKSGNPFLPSGNELAGYLALRGRYPMAEEHDLSRVAQYVGAARGEDELYLYLHEVFASEYAPTSLHRLLARLARHLGGTGQPHLVAVTSNYDDLLERAFVEQGLEFDEPADNIAVRFGRRGRFPTGEVRAGAEDLRRVSRCTSRQRPADEAGARDSDGRSDDASADGRPNR